MRRLFFLDSRDIINCVEKHQPCGATRLAAEFRKNDANLVLTFTNLIESIPRTSDVEFAVEFVRRLERIPHVFVQHTEISRIEFEEAITAYNSGRHPLHELPVFTKWSDYLCTFAPPDEPAPLGFRERLDRVPLSEQVRGLLTDGKGLGFEDRFHQMMAGTLAQNRHILGAKRAGKKEIISLIEDQVQTSPLVSDPKDFTKWVYADPSICPGWRLLQETFQELRSDTKAPLAKSDVPDMTHLYLVPYVVGATLDRKWREYVSRVPRKLAREGVAVRYRVFPDLANLRSAWRRTA